MKIYHGLDADTPELVHSECFVTVDTRNFLLGLNTGQHGIVNVNLSELYPRLNLSGPQKYVRNLHATILGNEIAFAATNCSVMYRGLKLNTLRPLEDLEISVDNVVLRRRGGELEYAYGTGYPLVERRLGVAPENTELPTRANVEIEAYDSYGRNVNAIAVASMYPMDPQEPYREVTQITGATSEAGSPIVTCNGTFTLFNPHIIIGDVIYFGGMPGQPDPGQPATFRTVVTSVENLTVNGTIEVSPSTPAFTNAKAYLARPRRLKTMQDCIDDIEEKWPNTEANDTYGELPLILIQNQPFRYEHGDVLVVRYTKPSLGPFGRDPLTPIETKTVILKVAPSEKGLYQSRRTSPLWNDTLEGVIEEADSWWVRLYNDRRAPYDVPRNELALRLVPYNNDQKQNYRELLAIASAVFGHYYHAHLTRPFLQWQPWTRYPASEDSHLVVAQPGPTEYRPLGDYYIVDSVIARPYIDNSNLPWTRYNPHHAVYPDVSRGVGCLVSLTALNKQFIRQKSGFSGYWPPTPQLDPDSRFDYDAPLMTAEPWRNRDGIPNRIHQINYLEADDAMRDTYENVLSGRLVDVLTSASPDRPNTISRYDMLFFVQLHRYFPNTDNSQALIAADSIQSADKRIGLQVGGTVHTPKYMYIRSLTVMNYNETTRSLQFIQTLVGGVDTEVRIGDIVVMPDPQLNETPTPGSFVRSPAAKPVQLCTIGRFDNNDVWARCVVNTAPPMPMRQAGAVVWVLRNVGAISTIDKIQPGSSGELLVDGGFAHPDNTKPFILAGDRVLIDEIQSIKNSSPTNPATIPAVSRVQIEHQGLIRAENIGAIDLQAHRQTGQRLENSLGLTPDRPLPTRSVAVNIPRCIVKVNAAVQLRENNTVAVLIFDLSEYRAGASLRSNTHFQLHYNATPTRPLGGIIIRLPQIANNGEPIVPNGYTMSYSLQIPRYQFTRLQATDPRAGREVLPIDVDTLPDGFFMAYTVDNGDLINNQAPVGDDEWARRSRGGIISPHAPIAPRSNGVVLSTPALIQAVEHASSTGMSGGWARVQWNSLNTATKAYVPLWNAEFVAIGGVWVEMQRASTLVDRLNPMAAGGNQQSTLGRNPESTPFESFKPIALFSDVSEYGMRCVAYTSQMNNPYADSSNEDEDGNAVPDNPIAFSAPYDFADTLREAVLGTHISDPADRTDYLALRANQHRCVVVPYFV
jgi:hypothetical protein